MEPPDGLFVQLVYAICFHKSLIAQEIVHVLEHVEHNVSSIFKFKWSIWGTLMRKLEDKQTHQKGRQDASAWVSEMKEETLLGIKEFQDHEHTISEESREEMDMEKP